MGFERLISLRYLRAKRKQRFISMISLFSMIGIALGVCALIVVLSVMNGFQMGIRDKILGLNAHVIILSRENKIRDWPLVAEKALKVDRVTGASPFILSQAMVSHLGQVSGLVIRGVDPDTVDGVTLFRQSLTSGDPLVLNSRKEDPRQDESGKQISTKPLPAIVLGKELASNLGAGVGAVVRLISPFGRTTPMGRTEWRQDFMVVDLFKSGFYEYDSSMAFLSLDQIRAFLGLDRVVTGIELKVEDIYAAPEIARQVAVELGYPYWTRDWSETHSNLYAAFKLDKLAMWIILTLIVLVAAFNIVSTLIMVVMEKTKDIAILKSIGARSGSIMKIFIFQGLAQGVIGTGLGLALGLFLCEILRRYKFIELPSDVYYITNLPVRVEPLEVALITAASVMISFLATLYPSRQAARLDPVEALRYE